MKYILIKGNEDSLILMVPELLRALKYWLWYSGPIGPQDRIAEHNKIIKCIERLYEKA